VEDRISELKDEIDIKKKTELLVKHSRDVKGTHKNSVTPSKRPNLRILGIEGEEVQTKGIHNIFNKIIAENFPNLMQVLPIQVQEASRTPNRWDQNKASP
jgi:hypothetical protein